MSRCLPNGLTLKDLMQNVERCIRCWRSALKRCLNRQRGRGLKINKRCSWIISVLRNRKRTIYQMTVRRSVYKFANKYQISSSLTQHSLRNTTLIEPKWTIQVLPLSDMISLNLESLLNLTPALLPKEILLYQKILPLRISKMPMLTISMRRWLRIKIMGINQGLFSIWLHCWELIKTLKV